MLLYAFVYFKAQCGEPDANLLQKYHLRVKRRNSNSSLLELECDTGWKKDKTFKQQDFIMECHEDQNGSGWIFKLECLNQYMCDKSSGKKYIYSF